MPGDRFDARVVKGGLSCSEFGDFGLRGALWLKLSCSKHCFWGRGPFDRLVWLETDGLGSTGLDVFHSI